MWTAGRLGSREDGNKHTKRRTRATNSVVATDPAASRSTFRASLSNAFSSTALNFSAGARACFALSPRFACVFRSGSRRWRLWGVFLSSRTRSRLGHGPRATALRGPADGSELGERRPPGRQQRTPKNAPRSARGAPICPRPAATFGRRTGARCRARPVPASMACYAVILEAPWARPSRPSTSEWEWPSRGSAARTPPTRSRSRSTPRQKDAGSTPGPPTCAARGP